MAETAASWMRANLSLAVTLMALAGTIIGGIVAGSAWIASVHHLERRVDVLRNEVGKRDPRDDGIEPALWVGGDVRRGLEVTDAALKEGLGRVDERLKAVERRP